MAKQFQTGTISAVRKELADIKARGTPYEWTFSHKTCRTDLPKCLELIAALLDEREALFGDTFTQEEMGLLAAGNTALANFVAREDGR